jgi:hypothetical protein
MHSHDRTLISKLGFGDADKSDNRHDLACQYLTTEAAAVFDVKGKCTGYLEQPLNKGTGKYKTTIGFVDVCGLVGTGKKERPFVIEVKIKPVGVGDILRQVALYREYAPNLECFRGRLSFGYDDDDDDDDDEASKLFALWGLVADFDLSNSALKALESADIHFARLGPGFEKWLKQAGGKSSKKVKVL